MNKAHGPTKENRQNLLFFWIFPAHAKNGPRWAQMDPVWFFPTNLDPANILRRTDFDFENFYFLDFLGSQLGPSLAQLGSSLGPAWARAWARLGPGLGPGLGLAWARLGPGLGLGPAGT